MALRGSLHEFELPDIFQLIGNDGKTGQLVLYNKDIEAFVIFSHGAVIAAGNNILNLQTVLFKFLISVKNYFEEEINELLYLCQGEMKLFTQELVNKQYVSGEELTILARLAVEDLACGLFLWESGHYRFDSLDSVDDYMVGSISLSSDAITMEAMRRVDEWKRIKKAVYPENVFAQINQIDTSPQASQIFDPSAYILSLVDGKTTISSIVKNTFFTEYRVFETLLGFWRNNKIIPLKGRLEREKSAPQQSAGKYSPVFNAGVFSCILVHMWVMLALFGGFAFSRSIFFKKNHDQAWSRYEWSMAQSENKIRAATFTYHAISGYLPTALLQLENAGYIIPKDETFFKFSNLLAP